MSQSKRQNHQSINRWFLQHQILNRYDVTDDRFPIVLDWTIIWMWREYQWYRIISRHYKGPILLYCPYNMGSWGLQPSWTTTLVLCWLRVTAQMHSRCKKNPKLFVMFRRWQSGQLCLFRTIPGIKSSSFICSVRIKLKPLLYSRLTVYTVHCSVVYKTSGKIRTVSY